MTSPEVERAALHYVCAHHERKWAGRRSNPRYLIFSQALYRLSYQPKFFVRVGLFDRQESQRKRPGVFLTPGPLSAKAVAHQRVGPSVIFAYFFRWRARNPADHSPVGQMSRSTAAPLSDKRMRLGLECIISVTSALLYPTAGQMFRWLTIRVSDRPEVRAILSKNSKIFGHLDFNGRSRCGVHSAARRRP